MREIKFRAWNKETKKMCDEMTLAEHLNMEMNNGIAMGTVGMKQTKFDEAEKEHNHLIFMQYTGLKDKSSREIYEGDVLKYDGEKCPHCKRLLYEGHSLYQIIWNEEMVEFSCNEINGDNYMCPTIWGTDMKIMGNIYENPELLKNGK